MVEEGGGEIEGLVFGDLERLGVLGELSSELFVGRLNGKSANYLSARSW